jgi:hypothetical protein
MGDLALLVGIVGSDGHLAKDEPQNGTPLSCFTARFQFRTQRNNGNYISCWPIELGFPAIQYVVISMWVFVLHPR